MNRFLSVGLAVALLSLIVVSCGGAAPATTAPTAAAPAPTTAAPTTAAPTAVSGTPAAGAVPPAPSIKNPDTLVVAQISEPQSLDPAWDYETGGGEIIQQVYEPLVFYNRDKVDQYVPLLAEKWTTSPDGKTWTFNIRKGVKFSNGDPLTATDVAYSYIRGFVQGYTNSAQWIMLQPFFGPSVTSTWLAPGTKPGDKTAGDVVNAQFNGDFVAACEAAKKLIVPDDNAMTVTMTLKQPWAPFLASISNGWGGIVDMKWAVSQGDWDFNCANAQKYNNPEAQNSPLYEKMMGTGPYMLANWNHGNSITLDANPNYWNTQPLWEGGPSGPPKLKHIVINYVSEWGTRFAQMTTGDTDFIYVNNQYYPQIDPLVKEDCPGNGLGPCTQVNPNGFIRRYKDLPGLSQDSIFFNQQVNTTGGNTYIGSGKLDGNGIPPNFFSNIHVRKAFVACFDFDTFMSQTMLGEAVQPNGPVIPGELGYNKDDPVQKYSLDTCKSEFDAAAKEPGFENLTTKGFYLVGTYNAGNDRRQAELQILAAGLKKVNPKFVLSPLAQPFAVELNDQAAGRLPLFAIGWLEDYHDPNDWVGPYLSSGGTYGGTQKFEAGLQKQLDDLIAQALAETDIPKRGQLYAQLNKLAVDNALDIFVETPTLRHYEQMWVKGWYYNPIYSGQNISGYYYAYSKGQ